MSKHSIEDPVEARQGDTYAPPDLLASPAHARWTEKSHGPRAERSREVEEEMICGGEASPGGSPQPSPRSPEENSAGPVTRATEGGRGEAGMEIRGKMVVIDREGDEEVNDETTLAEVKEIVSEKLAKVQERVCEKIKRQAQKRSQIAELEEDVRELGERVRQLERDQSTAVEKE